MPEQPKKTQNAFFLYLEANKSYFPKQKYICTLQTQGLPTSRITTKEALHKQSYDQGGSPQAKLRPGSPTHKQNYDQGPGWLAGWRNYDLGTCRALGWLAGWWAGWLAD